MTESANHELSNQNNELSNQNNEAANHELPNPGASTGAVSNPGVSPPQDADLTTLTQQWKSAKAALQAAQDALLAVEVEIWNAVKDRLPRKGATTLDTGLKITTGFSERWDQERLRAVYQSWDAPVPFPFKGEWKPDGKAIAYIRDHLPERYSALQGALTLVDRKPSFSVKSATG